ncbi:MAG TPA: metallophosphoesterase [Anaerolineae bacterium]
MRESTWLNEPLETEEPVVNVLEEGLLHKIMVVFNIPSRWPGWAVASAGLLLAILSGLVWQYNIEDVQMAWTVVLVQTGFMIGDGLILYLLPRKQLSFGPWKAQFAFLAVPRTLTTAAVGLLLGAGWLSVVNGVKLFGVVQLLGTIAFIWGAIIEPFRLRLSEFSVITDRLPAGTPPIRLLHISDLHVERLTEREKRLLQLAQETRPDLIVITGDFVNLSYNRDPQTHAQVRQFLSKLSAPHGVYATLGSPTADLREAIVPIFNGLDVALMRQAWRHVDLGQGRELVLLGLDCTHHIPTDAARLTRLVEVSRNGVPQVLLYHSPELAFEAAAQGIELYLCGHTHGGQVRLPLIGAIFTSSKLGRRFVMGLYQLGRTSLYVSRGVGLEGLSMPRVRFLAPPEVTLVTIMSPEVSNQ